MRFAKAICVLLVSALSAWLLVTLAPSAFHHQPGVVAANAPPVEPRPLQVENAHAAPAPVVVAPTLRQAIQVRPLATHDFFLPGTQPGGLNATIPDSQTCNVCHSDAISDKWQGSMMANAARDPIFWAAVAVANIDVADSGEFCIRCHTPPGWLEGRSHPTDGSGLTVTDLNNGVACEVCHRMVDPVAATSSTDQAIARDAGIRAALSPAVPTDSIGSGMMILDPDDNRRGPFNLMNVAPHSAFQTDFLGQSTNAIAESRLCGTCHNVSNPALVWTENPPNSAPAQYWPKPAAAAAETAQEPGEAFPIERTYDEWLNSDYAGGGVFAPEFAGDKPNGIVASCQDCHMKRITGKAADLPGAIERDCLTTGCLPEHTFVGGNTWAPKLLQNTQWRLHRAENAALLDATVLEARQMLQKAATVTATLTLSGAEKIATVRVTNQTGHKLPTGYPEGRRMWLNLQAFDESGALIYQSGVYDPATGILTLDPDIKVYEAEQGLTAEWAQAAGLSAGASFHFVLNNTVVKDNRIPPRGYTVAAFDKPGLRPVGATYADGQHWDDTVYPVPAETESILATLYYQTASKEYVDFLRTEGGADGATVGALWDASKSPPERIATVPVPASYLYLPLVKR
jgi:hypothetical protein